LFLTPKGDFFEVAMIIAKSCCLIKLFIALRSFFAVSYFSSLIGDDNIVEVVFDETYSLLINVDDAHDDVAIARHVMQMMVNVKKVIT